MTELTDVQKERLVALLQSICHEIVHKHDQDVKDSMANNPLYSQAMIQGRLTAARQEMAKKFQLSLSQQDWLTGWGLIICHCKDSAGPHLLYEWESVPRSIQALNNPDVSQDATCLQEGLHISHEAMSVAYEGALKFYDNKDYIRALLILSCLAMFNPYFFSCWFLQGICHQALNAWPQAIYAYSLSAVLEPTSSLSPWHLAYCHFQNGEHGMALEFIKMAAAREEPGAARPDFAANLIQALQLTGQG